jgi:ATP adenylyltransferase
MIVSMVVAASDNDVIGRGGALPWHVPGDLRRFRARTAGHVVVMGRVTHQSILGRLGHPLPGRTSVVVSTTLAPPDGGQVRVARTPQEALELAAGLAAAAGDGEFFVIGGEALYRQVLPAVDRVYLTRVHLVTDGDRAMPAGWLEAFELTGAEQDYDDASGITCSYLDYRRVARAGGTPDPVVGATAVPAPGAAGAPAAGAVGALPHGAGTGRYCFENARNPEQLAEMRRLDAAGICLFCPDELARHPRQQILFATRHWSVTPNEFPYPGTALHLLLIPREHAGDMLELSEAARADFWQALAEVARRYELRHYGLGIRNGDCRLTGATIAHVHAHVLAGSGDDAAPPVRMRFSVPAGERARS